MNQRKLSLVVAMVLSGCVRGPEPFSTPVEGDDSIIFPLSVGPGVVEVGAHQQLYEVDGEVLLALMIATHDLFPPGTPNRSCRDRPEAHTYRLVRQGDIIFISIDEDPEYCGHGYPSLDSGAKYAISADGRILRRVIGSQADHGVWRLRMPDGGSVIAVTAPGVIPDVETLGMPDSGVLKVTPEPVDMPGVMVLERPEGGSQAVVAEPGVVPGGLLRDAGPGGEAHDGGLEPVPQKSLPLSSSSPEGGLPDAGGGGPSPDGGGT